MKKRILRTFAGLIVIAAFTLPACEMIEDCGTCQLVTDDGTDITYGAELYFCGDTYTEKVNSSATTIGNIVTYWSCK